MNQIHKYLLTRSDRQMIFIPEVYTILSVGLDPLMGTLCVWAMVDLYPYTVKRNVEIILVATGQPVPPVGSFIGTVEDGAFIWHVFTGPGDASNHMREFHYKTRRK